MASKGNAGSPKSKPDLSEIGVAVSWSRNSTVAALLGTSPDPAEGLTVTWDVALHGIGAVGAAQDVQPAFISQGVEQGGLQVVLRTVGQLGSVETGEHALDLVPRVRKEILDLAESFELRADEGRRVPAR